MKGYRIKDSIWFSSPTGTVGIVLIQDPIIGLKAYIGVCEGEHQSYDEIRIAELGAPLPRHIAMACFNGYREEDFAGEK